MRFASFITAGDGFDGRMWIIDAGCTRPGMLAADGIRRYTSRQANVPVSEADTAPLPFEVRQARR